MKNYMLTIWKHIHQILDNRKRYKKMLDFYSQFIRKGDLCFDIGAHMGNRTEILLRLGAKVIAVEPQERCVNYLEQKFNKEQRLTLINKGLSDKEGKLTFYVCEDTTVISTFSDKWKTGRFSNYKWKIEKLAPVTTLDNLIREFGLPVFCKIDVEGYEFQVLKGLSRSISYISFEFTREFFDEAESCVNYLISLGYAKFNCSLGELTKMLFQTWVTPKKLYQGLNLVDDSLLWGDIYAKFI